MALPIEPDDAAVVGRFVLGIESSGPRSAVALAREGDLLFETAREGTGHNEVLLEMLDEVLNHTGVSLDRISAFGVTTGPGMFTALRVGVATALGLALPRGLPVKGVGTMPALAETCLPARRVLTLVDARRGQVYCGLYDTGRPLLEPRLVDPGGVETLVRSVPAGPAVLAGTGVGVCRGELTGLDVIDTGIGSPSAYAVACLALTALDRYGPDRPEDIIPRYLRRTDAEINREKRDIS